MPRTSEQSPLRADRVAQIQEELARWNAGVLVLGKPASASALNALSERLGKALPDDYCALMLQHNGADLRGDRVLSVEESLAYYESMASRLAPVYRDDPDWHHDAPPHELLPVAVDLEGNFKCLDTSTAPWQLVDWHRDTVSVSTWHTSFSAWLLSCLKILALSFDAQGRPRSARGTDADQIERLELEVQMACDPHAPHAPLELARWHERHSAPEETLFAYRHAAQIPHERAINHYEHARFAILCGRESEARRALRRCIAVPPCPNPRKHSFRSGHLPAAHALLARLYRRVAQRKKAEQQERAFNRALKRYGFGWYAESSEYRHVLQKLSSQRGEP